MINEEEQIEEKKGLEKAKGVLKNLGGKNLTFIVLGFIVLFLILIVLAVSLAGKKGPTTPRSTLTPTLVPPPQFIETPTPESQISSLETEVNNLKEELAKINLSDPNLTFPNLDFLITLQPK